MKTEQLSQLVDAIVAQVRGYVSEQLGARDKRVEVLEARIAELENRQSDPQRTLPFPPKRVA